MNVQAVGPTLDWYVVPDFILPKGHACLHRYGSCGRPVSNSTTLSPASSPTIVSVLGPQRIAKADFEIGTHLHGSMRSSPKFMEERWNSKTRPHRVRAPSRTTNSICEIKVNPLVFIIRRLSILVDSLGVRNTGESQPEALMYTCIMLMRLQFRFCRFTQHIAFAVVECSPQASLRSSEPRLRSTRSNSRGQRTQQIRRPC